MGKEIDLEHIKYDNRELNFDFEDNITFFSHEYSHLIPKAHKVSNFQRKKYGKDFVRILELITIKLIHRNYHNLKLIYNEKTIIFYANVSIYLRTKINATICISR